MRAPLKITFGMIVLNGAPFVDHAIRQVYGVAHRIVVVEGASRFAMESATADGHSTDDTLARVRRVPDPEGKIVVISRDGGYDEKLEQTNLFMEAAEGELVFLLDSDEFWEPAHVVEIAEEFARNPRLKLATCRCTTFVCGFDFVARGGRYEDVIHRVFRFEPGARFVDHRPPTVRYAGEGAAVKLRDDEVLSADDLDARGIRYAHYSYVLPVQVEQKLAYYRAIGFQNTYGSQFEAWYRDNWLRYRDPFHMHPDVRFSTWLEPFAGEHPAEIRRLLANLATEGVGGGPLELRATDDIWRVVTAPDYWRRVREAGVRERLERAAVGVEHAGRLARIAHAVDGLVRHRGSVAAARHSLRVLRDVVRDTAYGG